MDLKDRWYRVNRHSNYFKLINRHFIKTGGLVGSFNCRKVCSKNDDKGLLWFLEFHSKFVIIII